jgi:Mg-chelatase subunit ChlD
LSDGDANAPINRAKNPRDEVIEIAGKIASDGIPAIVIETGTNQKNRLMQELAGLFNTTCCRSADLKTSRIIRMVEDAE